MSDRHIPNVTDNSDYPENHTEPIPNSIAIAVWKMGVQPGKDSNSYMMLLFAPEEGLHFRIFNLPHEIRNITDAARTILPLPNVIQVTLPPPKGSLKALLHSLNPISLFNLKEIPMASIRPHRSDYSVSLCIHLDTSTGQLYAGTIFDSGHVGILPIPETDVDYIRLFADVCATTFGGQSEIKPDQQADHLLTLFRLMTATS